MKDVKYLIVGFSGAGKTHFLEKRLAQGQKGDDLDQLIVNSFSKEKYLNTREMILDTGLEYFRQSELSILKEWLEDAGPGEYLSLGGGAIHGESIQWLNQRDDWIAIYIEKSLDECLLGMKQRGESFLLELDQGDLERLFIKRQGLFSQLKNVQIY